MLYSVIDIGSSIIKYKVYGIQDKIEPIITHDKTVGLISYRKDGELTDEGITLLLNTLREFKNYSQKLNVNKSVYLATASLRNLDNQEEIISLAKTELNIDIKVLTGEEEAKYSFDSLKLLDIPRQEGIVVDIGGGSSEVSLFEDENRIILQESIPTGVLSIFNEDVGLLIPTKQEQENIINQTLIKIEELGIPDYDTEYLYGIGKSIVSVKKLFEHMKIKEDTGDIITIEQVDTILEKLSENTKENYKPLLKVDSERVHTMIPSLLIIKALAIKFKIKKLRVCNVTLQDGIIYNIAENF